MKTHATHRFLSILAIVALAGSPLAAADTGPTGVVRGAVSNAATGAYLDGAQITLSPGDVTVLTSRDGRFVIPHVTPGEHRLTVSYSGLDAKTVTGRVAAGATADYDIGLTSAIYQLDKFVVAGEREGNALAITQQRNADNVKTVIAADAFGNVADLNLGNFLMRLPGVSKEESEGEIIRVQIRGVNSNLSAVSLDGTRAANGSTRSFDRGFEIDKIPTDFIFRSSAGMLPKGNPFGDEYVGYELSTDFNGGFANVEGVEFSYQQQFSNLPGFWRGFGVYANYTYLKSEGNYGLFGVPRAELANFTPRAGNIGISYAAHGWSLRVKMTHTGRRLAVFSATNLASRTYNYPSSPVDFNIAYAFSRRLSVYADVINIFNVQTNNQYMYVPDRYNRADTYSTIVKFGVSGNF